jgi:hypothetical protein
MGRSVYVRRAIIVCCAVLLLQLMLVPVLEETAGAAPAAPPRYISRYMTTASGSTLYNYGCAQGTFDLNRAGTQHSTVVLDFGAVYYSSSRGTYMATLFGGTDQPLSTVREGVKQYGRGYWICTGADLSSTTEVGMGTNTSAGSVTYSAGAFFANRVDEVGSYYATIAQVSAAGANDIELGFSGPTAARNWVNGYDSANNWRMFNYGDAAGCPTDHIPSSTECGTAAHPEWGAEDVWYVSWGAPPAWPVPEIYTTSGSQARQWKYLSLYGYTRHGSSMYFVASLTQYYACLQVGGCSGTNNTPAQGWSQLWDQLNSDSRSAQTSFHSTDIRYS